MAARATFLLDPEGRVASVTADAAARPAFQAGGLTACEWQPGDRLLVLA
ncbi:MAG: hypothetical protein M3461_06805 [Pseudomonadota bacterium]|nr:hypothetical protein [Pseudomonadota bacterium]